MPFGSRFSHCRLGTKSEGAFVEINRRQLAVRFVAEDVVWFDFDVICGAGRRF